MKLTRGEAWEELNTARRESQEARDNFIACPCRATEKAMEKAMKRFEQARKTWNKFNK